jgi:hypothetical protein
MNRHVATAARRAARRAQAYRAWYVDPLTGRIPTLEILTDPRLQRREQLRQLRRAQLGFFDTVAARDPRAVPAR